MSTPLRAQPRGFRGGSTLGWSSWCWSRSIAAVSEGSTREWLKHQHYNIANSWFRRTWNFEENNVRYQFACKGTHSFQRIPTQRLPEGQTTTFGSFWIAPGRNLDHWFSMVLGKCSLHYYVEKHWFLPHWFSWMLWSKPVSPRDYREHMCSYSWLFILTRYSSNE